VTLHPNMKNLFFILLLLVMSLRTFGQDRQAYPASQAEVNAGVIHTKFVAPDTLAGKLGNGSNTFSGTFTGDGGGLTNLPSAMATNYTIFASSYFTNSYLFTNCPDTNYNQIFTYGYIYGTLGSGIWGYIYTNAANARFLNFIYSGANRLETDLARDQTGSIDLRAFSRLSGLNGNIGSSITDVNQTNLASAVWSLYGDGSHFHAIPGMVAIPLVAQTVTAASQYAGSFNGKVFGDLSKSYWYSEMLPFTESSAQASGPIIEITTWSSGSYAASDITNWVNYSKSNNLPVDGIMFDEGAGIGARTNSTGLPFWNTALYPDMLGLNNFIKTNGLRSDCWMTLFDGNGIVGPNMSLLANQSAYGGSPLPKLANDVDAVLSQGFTALTFDHVMPSVLNIDYQGYYNQCASIIASRIEAFQQTTNISANGSLSESISPIPVTWYGISKNAAAMSVASSYSFGGDIFLADNGFGPYSGNVAEQYYEQIFNFYTNAANWVNNGNGKTINMLGISRSIAATDCTNVVNIAAMEAYSCKLQGLVTSTANAPTNALNLALRNPEVMAIWKSSLVKMALPVTNWLTGSNAQTVVLAKPTSQPLKFAFLLWNQSTNTSTNITLNLASVSPCLKGAVLIHSPWDQADYQTNLTGALTYNNLAAMQTVLFTAELLPAPGLTATNSYDLTVQNPTSQTVILGDYFQGSISGGISAYYNFIPYTGKTNFLLTANFATATLCTNYLLFRMDVMGITNAVQQSIATINFTNQVTTGTNFILTFQGNYNYSGVPTPITLQPVVDVNNGGSFGVGWANLKMW